MSNLKAVELPPQKRQKFQHHPTEGDGNALRPIQVKDLALYNLVTNKPNPIKPDTASKDRRNVVTRGTDKYLGEFYNERFWTKLTSHFRTPEFIRCLYDELNEMDLTGIDWKKLRRQNLTSSYYDLAALYAPIEAIYFEELSQKIKVGAKELEQGAIRNERPAFTDWPYFPRPLYQNKIGWTAPVRFLLKDLHDSYVEWAVDRKHYQKSQPSQAKFLSQCKHLDLPLTDNNPLSNGLQTRAFVPKDMHDHVVARKWVEEDELEEVQAPPEDVSTEALCLKLVEDLVDEVVHTSEIDDRFTFKPQ